MTMHRFPFFIMMMMISIMMMIMMMMTESIIAGLYRDRWVGGSDGAPEGFHNCIYLNLSLSVSIEISKIRYRVGSIHVE